jgi:hypothetical protein
VIVFDLFFNMKVRAVFTGDLGQVCDAHNLMDIRDTFKFFPTISLFSLQCQRQFHQSSWSGIRSAMPNKI